MSLQISNAREQFKAGDSYGGSQYDQTAATSGENTRENTYVTNMKSQLTGSELEKPLHFEPEAVYSGSVGNDMGISTIGYRSGKFNPPEWHENNYAKYYESFTTRDGAEKMRHDANAIIKETEAHTQKVQDESTKKLGERLHDIHFWKTELNKEIDDVREETDLLVEQKRRMERALRETEIPLHIATDNLHSRQMRQGVDLVQDEVELNLLKEVEVINNVQDLLKKTIEESDGQVIRNRDRKRELEMDWSDKKEADEYDTKAGKLRNHHTNKQFYPGAARFQEIQSTPESWAQCSHDNITRAEHERMASIQLRSLINNILEDTSRDMREQADNVDMAFRNRVAELEDAKRKLEDNLDKVVKDIAKNEKNVDSLKVAIKAKEDPMKVAQTRLHSRERRPNVDLCRDPAQYHLVDEVHQIAHSVDALIQQLSLAEGGLKGLHDSRMQLAKEINNKKNSLFIEREKCMSHRTRYPSTLRLQGYQ